jgi:23S rRNA (cytidine1920-2'-O)/16S rRNA (cytidine1409-2'-O)-methyltransferase
MKDRADKVLVDRGFAPTRAQAKSLIDLGRVRVDGQILTKAAALLGPQASIEVDGAGRVGRGSFKLEAALAQFPVPVEGLALLDVGASTGGFTEALLEKGARHVYAVDVGHGQLARKLREDPRVSNMEDQHILALAVLPEPIHGAVIDLSFISVTKVLAHVGKLLAPEAWIIMLVKPQFEAGLGRLPKDGVIKDMALRQTILDEVLAHARGLGFSVAGTMPSPIQGKSGNAEWLVWLRSCSGG